MNTRHLRELIPHYSSDSYSTYKRKCIINSLDYLLQTLGCSTARPRWYKA